MWEWRLHVIGFRVPNTDCRRNDSVAKLLACVVAQVGLNSGRELTVEECRSSGPRGGRGAHLHKWMLKSCAASTLIEAQEFFLY